MANFMTMDSCELQVHLEQYTNLIYLPAPMIHIADERTRCNQNIRWVSDQTASLPLFRLIKHQASLVSVQLKHMTTVLVSQEAV